MNRWLKTLTLSLTVVAASSALAAKRKVYPIASPSFSFTKTNGFGYGDFIPLDLTLTGEALGRPQQLPVHFLHLIDAQGHRLGMGYLYIHSEGIDAFKAGKPTPLHWVLVDQNTATIQDTQAVGTVFPNGEITFLRVVQVQLEVTKPSFLNFNDIDVGYSEDVRLEMTLPGDSHTLGFVPAPESAVKPSGTYGTNPVKLPPEGSIRPGTRYGTQPVKQKPEDAEAQEGSYSACERYLDP